MNRLLRQPALAWGLACALTLTACGYPAPEPPETVEAIDIKVLSAAGDGTVTYLEQRNRGATDSLYTWFAFAGERLLGRIDNETLQATTQLAFLPHVPADLDAQTLWTAFDRPGEFFTTGVHVCFRHPSVDEPEQCIDLGYDTNRENPLALAGDGQREAVLLLMNRDGNSRLWRSAWVRADEASTPRFADLPTGMQDPVLLNGPTGAHVTWVDGGLLRVLQLDEAAMRWDQIMEASGVTHWATTQRRGASGEPWIAMCSGSGVAVFRLVDGHYQPLPAPPLDCANVAGPLQLAVSDNADAMLLWGDTPLGTWASARWSDGVWHHLTLPGAPADDAGLRAPPRLAAGDSGQFAALDLRSNQPLRLHVTLPNNSWREPIELAPDPVWHAGAGVALHGNTALAAWAQPRPGDDDTGSRLVTARLDLSAEYTTLQVQVQGSGSVRSEPPGIQCPDDCRADLPAGAGVRLEALPGPGQRFLGWDGLCSASPTPIASLVLPAEGGACTARFEAETTVALQIDVIGAGQVRAEPPGPDYAPGTQVTLTATPGAGQRFVAWGGDPDCADGLLTMDTAHRCSATFEPDPAWAALTLTLTGEGRVVSSPSGIGCPGACQAYFPLGSTVVLSVQVEAGTTITWSGACSGNGATTSVTLTAAAQCGVRFEAPARTGWLPLGGLLPGGGGLTLRPAIAADAAGIPTVAFLGQAAELRELQVLRLEGAGWQRIGGAPLNDPFVSASQPSLALDNLGRPIVAFGDARGRVQVRHWDGAQWRHLADDLSVAPGATTSAPQVAFDGRRAVVAFNEYQAGRVRLAMLRSEIDTASWAGGYIDGVQLDSDGDLRLALDAGGMARVAYVTSSGLAGERAPLVMQEAATGWTPLCEGAVGPDAGLGYANTTIGFGLQTAADGSAILVRTRGDFLGVQAWRCGGSGPWLTEGPSDGRLAEVDNVSNYLQAMAMAGHGGPTLAVLVGNGYDGSIDLMVYGHTTTGFAPLGPPLHLLQRAVWGALAVAPAGPGSPVAAYGVEAALGSPELHVSRYWP